MSKIVKVTFKKDHASFKTGDGSNMAISTAKALEKHGILTLDKATKPKEGDKK